MTTDDQPLGDDTDLAVIALLDDDLDRFAAARGTTAEEVRGRLEEWPGLPARVATVLATRRAADRIRRRTLRRGAIAASIGAAILGVILGIRFLARDDEPTAARAPHHSMGTHVMDSYIGGIGEIGDDRSLSAAIARRGPVDVGLGTGATSTSVLGGSGLPIAAERCVRVAMPGRRVSLVATGEFRGLAAAIWVTRVGRADVAFVSALDSCEIRYSLRLGSGPTP